MKSFKPAISMLAIAILAATELNGAEAPRTEPEEERMIKVKPGAVATENIVIEIDDQDSSDGYDTVFSSDRRSLGKEVLEKIEPLMKEAAFQKRIGNNEGALQIYDKILEIQPENDSARFNRGNTLIALERYEEALDDLLPLMEKAPKNFIIRNNVAWIYATANDIRIRDGRKAISLARDALMMAPKNYNVWNTLSEAYFVSAQYEKALEIAEISFQMALNTRAENQILESMAAQVRKCRQATATMSIME